MATISSLGIGSGLDLQGMLDQLRQIDEEAYITPLNDSITKINNQLAGFDSINQSVLDIQSDALSLALNTTFMGRTVNVGNSSVISASVVDGTTAGSHEVSVSRLATKSSWISQSGATSADAIASVAGGTFSFTVSSGDQVDVTVSANATLQELADAINNKDAGVTASVVNTGTGANPYKLAINANNTGESSRITITNQLGDFALDENQGSGGASLNTELTVNGITYQRNSNSNIKDIISGVTLNINSTGSSSLEVGVNTASVKDIIKGFVEKFNTLVSDIKNKTGYDEEGNPGLLTDLTSIKNLSSEITDLMFTNVDVGGSITNMIELGVSVNEDGTITIDETTLDDAIENNFDDVKNFFIGNDTVKGFADKVTDKMNSLTYYGTGILSLEQTTAQSRIEDIDNEITSTTTRLDEKFTHLTEQFTQLDVVMAQMQAIQDYLTSQFDALANYNS